MRTTDHQAALELDAATLRLLIGDGLDIRRGDTLIVRDVQAAADGTRIIRIVTERALRGIATRLLVD